MSDQQSGKNQSQEELKKLFFTTYDIVRVNASDMSLKANGMRCVILNFTNISDLQAKNRMMYLHSQLATNVLQDFHQKIEQDISKRQSDIQRLSKSDKSAESDADRFANFGKSFLMLNYLRQLQHQIKTMTNEFDKKFNSEDFLLEDEIHYSIDGVSMRLSENTENRIEFTYDKILPKVFSGDLEKFRLVIHTILDFSVKYCTDGLIEVKTLFEGKTNNNNYLIKFLFTFPLNAEFKDKNYENLLIRLLNENESTQQGQEVDKLDFTKKFKCFYELII